MILDKVTARKFVNRKIQRTRNECEMGRRNVSFNLTTDQVMKVLETQNFKCALSGQDLEFTTGGSLDGKNPNSCSIDRIDNSRGYESGNIQLTTVRVNLLRNKMTNQGFIDLCKQIANHCG